MRINSRRMAQRPLPSMMMAMCLGMRSRKTGGSSGSHMSGFADIKFSFSFRVIDVFKVRYPTEAKGIYNRREQQVERGWAVIFGGAPLAADSIFKGNNGVSAKVSIGEMY